MYTTKLVILKYYFRNKCVYFIYKMFTNGNYFHFNSKTKTDINKQENISIT